MRVLARCILAVGLVTSPAMAAGGGNNGAASPPGAPAAAEPANAASPAKPAESSIESELRELRDRLTAQAKQLQEQQQKMAVLEEQLKASSSPPNTLAVASAVPGSAAAPLAAAVAAPQGAQSGEASPLQFRIGTAYITPVGFMDFTGVWRNRDGGSGIGTNFAGIPYGGSTSIPRNLGEFRESMQNSRIGLRVDAQVKGAHVIGYMESDYLGNNPGNVAVSSNSNTLRSRLYWVDVRKDQWEVLGGQTWSLITPSRSGISPLPGDLFFTQNIDVNYQLGLVWGRIPEFRFVYHPSDKAAFAIALDSPEQYIGGSAGGGLITLPAALSSYTSELNNGTNTLGVPNRGPDVVAKFALDPSKRFHFEIGGLARFFRTYNPNTGTHFSATGGGGFLNMNFEIFKGLRLLTNNFWSDGGGRYIFGQAPDLIVRADGSPSLVHSGATVTGFEFTHKNTLLYSYYGGLYVSRNATFDANGTTPIGYGFTGSPSGQNRSVQEGTFGFNQTFWKDAKYGALNFMGQYSYLTRDPWSVATASPKNALLSMVFVNLRYTLPGSAPTLGK